MVLAVATPSEAGATRPPRLSYATQATKADLDPARTYTAPSLVVDPDDQTHVFGAAAELRSRTCHLVTSADAGRTWTIADASPSPPSYPFCSTSSGMLTQTPLAWGRNHTLYFAMAGWDSQDGGVGGNASVVLARSTDLGRSWTTTIVRDARGKTGPQAENNGAVASLVVDTTTAKEDVVYVGWRANFPNLPLLTGGLRPLRPPMVAVSTDAGRTFSDPIDVSSFYKPTVKGADGTDRPVGMGFTAPSLALDGKGTLFVLYPGAIPAAFPATAPAPKLPLLLARSADRGKTFDFTEAGAPLNHNEAVQILRWSPQGGGAGTLHMIYEDSDSQTTADRDIFYMRSTDGGRTFTPPHRLNDDDPKQQRVQVTPNFSVAPNGRLDVAWWDFRNDPGSFVNDVYATSSADNGMTWSANLRITDQSINRKVGVWSNGYDIRQPPGIASGDQLTTFAWDDTRLGDDLTQTQDIFSRSLQYAALGGTGGGAPGYAAAAFAGLAVVGVILLALSRRRRLHEPPPMEPRDRQPAPLRSG